MVVNLLDSEGVEIATTLTASDGLYGFFGMPSGEYRIEVLAPSLATFTLQDQGSDDLIDSDADPSTGQTDLFSYSADSDSRSHDAGLIGSFVVLINGFESGDLSAWSSAVP